MTCITDCDAPTVPRDYLYSPSRELRHRYAKNSTDHYNIHRSYANSIDFNAGFHTLVGNAVLTVGHYAAAAGHGTLQWIGHDGAQVCKSLCHSTGRALDITALEFSNTSFDMYNAWRDNQPLAQQRGYLAVWAGLRIYCTTVLTHTFDTFHRDHIHVDSDSNGVGAPPAIRDYMETDSALVQTACNLLNEANLVIDNSWGPLTTQAYNNLLDAFDMNCLDPKANYWHAQVFLGLIARHGFESASAGEYPFPFCG